MSKLSYNDIKSVIKWKSSKKTSGYDIPLMPRLNKLIGNIEGGQIHAVGGLPSSDFTGFIDEVYVLNTLLQWYDTEPTARKPLKIFYFSMRDTELKKLMALLSSYLKLVHNLNVDVQTLLNKKGRIYNIMEDTDAVRGINEATPFFDEILDDEILTIEEGQFAPSGIFSIVSDYMNVIGHESKDGSYVPYSHYEDATVLVIVDTVDYLINDLDEYGAVAVGRELHNKMMYYTRLMKMRYGITTVLAVPSDIPFIRKPDDTIPDYKHFGTYGRVADKVIGVYNPIAEGNQMMVEDADAFTTLRGNTLLRYWYVLKNNEGPHSAHDKMLFMPGPDYFIEHSKWEGEVDIVSLSETMTKLTELSPFYKPFEDIEDDTVIAVDDTVNATEDNEPAPAVADEEDDDDPYAGLYAD